MRLQCYVLNVLPCFKQQRLKADSISLVGHRPVYKPLKPYSYTEILEHAMVQNFAQKIVARKTCLLGLCAACARCAKDKDSSKSAASSK
jgi:hypothetical protein